MNKHIVIVDAGYLLTEGSRLLAGVRIAHDKIEVDTAQILNILYPYYNLSIEDKFHVGFAPLINGIKLLRVYWYDGIARTGILSPQQEKIADTNHFKFRFGFVNAARQQKGVDALITTDLIELARNKAISDVVIISGDEDLVLGIQLAQSYGIRCHVIGIAPVGKTQSLYLRREADSAHIWDKDIVSQILKLNLPTP